MKYSLTFLSLFLSLNVFAENEKVLTLQPYMVQETGKSSDGHDLIFQNINPTISKWFVLKMPGIGQLHLEAPDRLGKTFHLEDGGLIGRSKDGKQQICKITANMISETKSDKKNTHTPFCLGLWSRNETKAYKSTTEAGTDVLREAGGAGESIINLYKAIVPAHGDKAVITNETTKSNSDAPASATFFSGKTMQKGGLGIEVEGPLSAGGWVKSKNAEMWVSAATPSMASSNLNDSDGPDSSAYFVALNVSNLESRYQLGVDHPKFDWSKRTPVQKNGPGPDGFSTIDPFVRTGAPAPWEKDRIVLALAGGFKREHSAFKHGKMATEDNGTHYGIVQDGVVLTPLKKGLITALQRVGEQPDVRVWTAEDEAKGFKDLIFARQNGLALVHEGKATADSEKATGNWSGNAEGSFLTFRSVLCQKVEGNKRWWIFGVFTAASPRAVAKTMESYGCSEAMQLDMNAPVLGYASISFQNGAIRDHQPLLKSMDDKGFGRAGRFIFGADTRDFIYLMQK